MRRTALIACLCLAAPPHAAQEGCFGAGEPLFHCRAGGKAVDICLQGEVVIYSYGPGGGAAELLLARRVEGVGMVPWNGIGRTLWEELTFYNGTYAYAAHYAVDRLAEGAPKVEAGVEVREGERRIARVTCDAGSVTRFDFYPVYEAKEAAGQCWSRERFEWERC